MTTHEDLRAHFLLDPDVFFLNHGSFGACPRPVFEAYQRWQLELERQPVEFLGRRHDLLLDEAREQIGRYLNADADCLAFVPNTTVGINAVARSLALSPGDEILATDHEYGAIDYTWDYICGQTGARYVHQPMPVPMTTAEAFVDAFWSGVNERTRVISISHVTSPTALIFPIAPILARARAAGIITVVDGAHAPGQIPVDLAALDADFYSGNFHKWLCAPKGAGFLYAARPFHKQLVPPTISWGWSSEASFVSKMQYQGTRDIAAFLAVSAAITFQETHRWSDVRERCHALASEARARIGTLTGLTPIQPDSADWYGQMVTLPLPACDTDSLKRRLYDEYRVEAPMVVWNERPYIRVSFQGYNSGTDLDQLEMALAALLPQVRLSSPVRETH